MDLRKKKNGIFGIDKLSSFSEWFTEICKVAELADVRYGVKGFTPFPPWSTVTMAFMFQIYESALQLKGHLPMIFPTVIPKSNLTKEAAHVEGFTPEVFWIERFGNGVELSEPLALRPTSEAAIYPMYSLWVKSYRDLPLKRYQTGSVFRSEIKNTRPFLRSKEFLWLESHNVFESHEHARNQVMEDLQTTQEVVSGEFGIPVIVFKRTEWDKFAGAVDTFAADTLMPDGQIIQLPSTHDLGDNFSKAFHIKYLNRENRETYAFQTCYGPAISRIYGAMIALHGDDRGLRLLPKLAPYQIAIIPILKGEGGGILALCRSIEKELKEKGYRVHLDDRPEKPGWKYHYWEMKGVPIRLEIGQNELDEDRVVIFRRDKLSREAVGRGDYGKRITQTMFEIDESIKAEAKQRFEGNIEDASYLSDVASILSQGKIARVSFCSIDADGRKCADAVKEKTGGEVRGVRIDIDEYPSRLCVSCEGEAKHVVYIARSY